MAMRTLLAVLAAVVVMSVHAVPVALTPEAPEKPACKTCMTMVENIQSVVKSANQTYEESCMKFIDVNVCDKLPADVQENCKSVVSQEIPDIWAQIINDYLDPKTTCDKLSLCTLEAPPSPDVQCKLCKKAASWLDKNIFEDPDVEAKVALRLKEVCAKLADKGKEIEKKCEDIIDDDIADMMAQIGKQLATDLCRDIGACTGPGPTPKPTPKP